MTHGKWVSENARYACWSLEVPGTEDTADMPEGDLVNTSSADEDVDPGDLSAKEERRADQAAGRAEQKPLNGASGRGGGQGRGGGRP